VKCALLDVNVLLALLDHQHMFHELAFDWFNKKKQGSWATCPITQNGFVRILSRPRYLNPVPAPIAIEVLRELTERPDHIFWPDSASLLDPNLCNPDRIVSARQVTDTYLLALAKANDGIFVTFDAKLITLAVDKGSEHLLVLS
jgi:uncharacterized protein